MMMMLPKKDKASSTLRKLKRARDDKLNSECEYDDDVVAGHVVGVAVLEHEPHVGGELARVAVLALLQLGVDRLQVHGVLDKFPARGWAQLGQKFLTWTAIHN